MTDSEDGPDIAAAVEELRKRATREPLGVDISDYSDEWCAGFLRGQVNALEEAGPAIAKAIRDWTTINFGWPR